MAARVSLLGFIDRLLYRAAARPAGALFFGCCAVGYVLPFVLCLHYMPDNHVMKIVFSACVWVPLPFAWWFLIRGFIAPLFNSKADDDQHANVVSFMVALGVKIIGMSTIYMIMYVWRTYTFELLSVTPYLNTWGMFIAMSTYLTAGTAPPSTFDTTSPLSALITALDIYISYALNLIIFTSVVRNAMNAVKEKAVYTGSTSRAISLDD